MCSSDLPKATQGVRLLYANGVEVLHVNNGFGITFHGSEGVVKVNRGKFEFFLGTDQIGRDLFSRLIYGARNTIGIAFLVGEHYADIDAIRNAFVKFVSKVPFYGAAIVCLDDANVQQILPRINRRVITYGTTAQADLRVVSVRSELGGSVFGLERRGVSLGCFRVRVPGAHNVLNATAAIAVGSELDIPLETIREGLESFTGVDRRFQVKGQERGVTVVDDYGHHPTEIKATLAAARSAGYSKIHVLFQPHRYTRTAALLDEFAGAFHAADTVHVTQIYAASEKPIEGVSGESLAERIHAFGHRGASFASSMDAGIDSVAAEASEGSVIITLGAGSVSQAGEKILERLQRG